MTALSEAPRTVIEAVTTSAHLATAEGNSSQTLSASVKRLSVLVANAIAQREGQMITGRKVMVKKRRSNLADKSRLMVFHSWMTTMSRRLIRRAKQK